MEEPAAGDLEAGGVVAVRCREGDAVGGVVSEAETKAVHHDVGVAVFIRAGLSGGDKG